MKETALSMLTLTGLFIYPVKGLRGLSLPHASVELWGLAGDRRWMIVDETGRFLTQRQCPAMATLTAHPHEPGLHLWSDAQGSLVVPYPGRAAAPLKAQVWKDNVTALEAGHEAQAWLSRALGRSCRLVYMDQPATARVVDPEFSSVGDHVSFADGFPLLATSTGSLADLERRLGSALPMDRFRTNLVLDGAPAWQEDGWTSLRVGSALFRVVKPCARCIVTTTDQNTGQRDAENEPIRTLQRFRRDRTGAVLFGQNLIPIGAGRIAIGDRCEAS